MYAACFKRLFDVLLCGIAFLLFSPLFYFVVLFIKLDSPGPAFFKQKRIGKGFKPFWLVKFRSMAMPSKRQGQFDPGDKSRITRVGALLRKTKIDELPQLLNVLSGDMSIVGPRPEVEKYVKEFRDDYRFVLRVSPGLSDLASLKYRNEEEILSAHPDPDSYYKKEILPDKLRLAKVYVETVSLQTDFRIIVETLKSIVKE
jgi:lipopolysaccharide/colanic/teichoic acid biosynthesis glycosyltransferase